MVVPRVPVASIDRAAERPSLPRSRHRPRAADACGPRVTLECARQIMAAASARSQRGRNRARLSGRAIPYGRPCDEPAARPRPGPRTTTDSI